MLKVLIIGGTGLIGQYVSCQLSSRYDIYILTRQSKKKEGNISYLRWNPNEDLLDPAALDCEVIVNLSGESIAAKRWTTSRKKELIESRVLPLAFLAKKLSEAKKRPSVFISASAIGYYGDRGNIVLDENSSSGQGFLSSCTVKWETAAFDVAALAERSAILRLGIVLSTQGGALPELMMTSKVGILSYFGNMFYSWIHIQDVSNIIDKAIKDSRYAGILNSVSPVPIENKKLIETLAEVLGVKVVVPAPAFALKLLLGEKSAIVLDSTRVVPSRLLALGHSFQFSDLRMALEDLLFQQK